MALSFTQQLEFNELKSLFGRFQYWNAERWEEVKDDFTDAVNLEKVTKFFRASRTTYWKEFKQQQLDELPAEMRKVQELFERSPKIRGEPLKLWCAEAQLPMVEVLCDLMWLEEQELGFNDVSDDEEGTPVGHRAVKKEDEDVIFVKNEVKEEVSD